MKGIYSNTFTYTALPPHDEVNQNELYHHGILGQKWGVRRYQNKDGSLTPEGKKRVAEEVKRLHNGPQNGYLYYNFKTADERLSNNYQDAMDEQGQGVLSKSHITSIFKDIKMVLRSLMKY